MTQAFSDELSHDPSVLVVGEALVDVVRGDDGHDTDLPGGSAANVAVALARLGRPTWLATCFADDRLGRLLDAHLSRDGVRMAADPGAVVDHTSSAVVSLAPDGSASYEFDLDWRLGPLHDLPEVVVVHTCSLGAVLEPGADDVLALVRRLSETALVSYDVNVRAVVTGTGPDVVARIEAVAATADVVKASDEDLEHLYPDLGPLDGARRLLGLGPAVVVLTRGEQGSTWVSADGEVSVPVPRVEVADTIGAGDTFCAGLLHGLWERGVVGPGARERLLALDDEARAALLALAARAAAITVSRPGADPPYAEELLVQPEEPGA
ncbi:carbohydrate kinase [Nocardioides sp. CFH 31398]|uniref:carbohydrate kinase family protein n=1 Tax=Nocardioides sp. CFH 31398 TaxID=2919579 RepID=UPI001F06243D|nr:carbohydrate kinase [Nocardioides sp. CFH 31398]MCH1868998.1 carbohydrate kinase [Nocardioides sp. CFH 31398]